jgi:hypothetical protein
MAAAPQVLLLVHYTADTLTLQLPGGTSSVIAGKDYWHSSG